jgi:hypothetical protein
MTWPFRPVIGSYGPCIRGVCSVEHTSAVCNPAQTVTTPRSYHRKCSRSARSRLPLIAAAMNLVSITLSEEKQR